MLLRLPSLSFFLIILFISGCATSYHPENRRGYGFNEKQLSEQSYLVSFRGNSRTSPIEVQHMLLRRCAELTIQKGYSYFLILDKESIKESGLTYNASTKDYEHDEKHSKSVQIYMANEKDVSPEGRQKAINAGIYLRNK